MRFSTWLKTSRAQLSPMTEWYSGWLVFVRFSYKDYLYTFYSSLWLVSNIHYNVLHLVEHDRKGLLNT